LEMREKVQGDPEVPTEVTIYSTLRFGVLSRFVADASTIPTIDMRILRTAADVDGTFEIHGTDPIIENPNNLSETGLSGLGELTLIAEFNHTSGNSPGLLFQFEVAGKDEGLSTDAFDADNFLLHKLVLGGPRGNPDDPDDPQLGAGGMAIEFVDACNNQGPSYGDEVLYVETLEMLAGIRLVPGSPGPGLPYKVYYRYGYSDTATGGDGTPKRLYPGDANMDGYVDVGDLGILGSHYGTTTGMTWGFADFTGDRAVDVGDWGILGANYGSGYGGGDSMQGKGGSGESRCPPLVDQDGDGDFDIDDVRIILEKYKEQQEQDE